MALIEIDWRPGTRQLRQFAAMFLVFLCGAAALAWWKGASSAVWGGLVGAGVVVGGVGLALPRWIHPVYVAMMAISMPIGLVVSTVLMIVIYYLVVTPIGLLARLFGYDPMRRRFDATLRSYWVRRTPPADRTRYFRQY